MSTGWPSDRYQGITALLRAMLEHICGLYGMSGPESTAKTFIKKAF